MCEIIKYIGVFYAFPQNMQANALYSWKIYTAGKFFTRPLVVTNLKSADDLVYNVRNICNRFDKDGKTNPLVYIQWEQ